MEISIIIWALSACVCASWMSARAIHEGMHEFRWYVAGLVGSVLAVPFFLYAVHRASLDQAASLLEEDVEDFADSRTMPSGFDLSQDTMARKAA